MNQGIMYYLSAYATEGSARANELKKAKALGLTLVWTPSTAVYDTIRRQAVTPEKFDAAIVAALLAGKAFICSEEGDGDDA